MVGTRSVAMELPVALAATVSPALEKELDETPPVATLLSFETNAAPPKRPRDLKLPSNRKSFRWHAVEKADTIEYIADPLNFAPPKVHWASRRVQRGGFDGAPPLGRECVNGMWLLIGLLLLGAAGFGVQQRVSYLQSLHRSPLPPPYPPVSPPVLPPPSAPPGSPPPPLPPSAPPQ